MAQDPTPPIRIRLRLRYALLLIASDAVFFGVTNPTHAHVWLLMVGGLLTALTIWAMSVAFVRVLAHIIYISRRGQRLLGGILAAASLYIVGMQSIGQLNVRDTIALFVLGALFYFYASYTRAPNRTRDT